MCAGQPALSSFIPPSVDSLILDYQSPNAQPGFYPNEIPNSGGVGGCSLPVSATRSLLAGGSLHAAGELYFTVLRDGMPLDDTCGANASNAGLDELHTTCSCQGKLEARRSSIAA